jgi:hypothetical protein
LLLREEASSHTDNNDKSGSLCWQQARLEYFITHITHLAFDIHISMLIDQQPNGFVMTITRRHMKRRVPPLIITNTTSQRSTVKLQPYQLDSPHQLSYSYQHLFQ